jgi:peroxiredoxin
MSQIRRIYPLFSVFLLILGLGWIYLSRPTAGGATSGLSNIARKGFKAPDFELQNITNETVRLSDYLGKPVILNLWASWCPPCREEMPTLNKIDQAYSKRGLIVLGVNMTAQDSLSAAVDFLRQNPVGFMILFDQEGDAARKYLVQALPTTYFISTDGTVQDLIVGGPIDEATFRAQAENLLKGLP